MKKILNYILIAFIVIVGIVTLITVINTFDEDYRIKPQVEKNLAEKSAQLEKAKTEVKPLEYCRTEILKCSAANQAKYGQLSSQITQLSYDIKILSQKNQYLQKPQFDRFIETEKIALIYTFIISIILIFLVGVVILLFYRGVFTSASDSHGSANFIEDDELKIFSKDINNTENGDFHFGFKNKNSGYALPHKLTNRHTAILGPSGTGKSRRFYMPNLQFLANKASIFIHDTKGELWETTSGYWDNAIRFAPHNPNNSMSFNWIPLCTDNNRTLVLELAETIISNGGQAKSSDSFWERVETGLLAGIFAHVATTDCPTPAYAYDLIMTLTTEQIIELLLNSNSRTAREQGQFVDDSDPRTRNNVLTGLRSTLNWLGDEKVRAFTSSETKGTDFTTLRQSNLAIYWCLPSAHSEILRPLTCLAVKLLFTQLQEVQGNHVYLFLDEFDSMGKIPKFDNYITLVRGFNISIVIGIQSFSQLTKTYDRNIAQTILDNLQNKIVLAGLEYETAERISKNLGEFTFIETATSHSSSGMFHNSSTTSEKKHARRLMTADEIRRLEEGTALVISTNIKPILTGTWFFNSENETEPTARKNHRCSKTLTLPVERKKEVNNNTKKKKPPIPPNFNNKGDFPDVIYDE